MKNTLLYTLLAAAGMFLYAMISRKMEEKRDWR
mgnify:CR=1 FL=1